MTHHLIPLSLITGLLLSASPLQANPQIAAEGQNVQLQGTLLWVRTPPQDPDMSQAPYLCLKLPAPLTLRPAQGPPTATRYIQLAGLSAPQIDKLLATLKNKPARATGQLMSAHTRYHRTPILLIVQNIRPATPNPLTP